MKRLVAWMCVIVVVFLLNVSGGSAAEEYEIAYVAKLIGIPWFNVTEDGIREAAKDLGVNGYLVGPPDPDPAQPHQAGNLRTPTGRKLGAGAGQILLHL